MKILSLKALNINSLKGNISIDFEALTKQSALFAIVGPTGSGKSTILDIISCALYGRTARLKNPNDLISRQCGEAYCEVEFEVKGKRYRSSWAQRRAHKKHDGAFQSAKMELVDLSTDTIIPLKSREVPKKVEELSGLDFGRFTQSMLLAQGGFDAFLKADEKERSALLEKITGTQIYATISQKVFEKYRFYEQELSQQQTLIDAIEVLSSEDRIALEQNLHQVQEQKEQTQQDIQKLTNSLAWFQRHEELQNNLKEYTDGFALAQRLKEQHKDSFEKLHLAHQALALLPQATTLQQLQKSIEQTDAQHQNLTQEIKELYQNIQQHTIHHTQLQEQLKTQTKEYEKTQEKLKQTRKIATQQESIATQLAEYQNTILTMKHTLDTHVDTKTYKEQLDREYETTRKELEQYQEQSITLQEALKEAEASYKVYEEKTQKGMVLEDTLTQELTVVQKLLDSLQLYENQIHQKQLKQEQYTHIQTQLASLQEMIDVKYSYRHTLKKQIELLREKEAYEQLVQKYEAQRGYLKDGEPCFVCGATTHPFVDGSVQPPTTQTKALREQEELHLEDEEKLLRELEKELSKTQEHAKTLALEITTLQEQLLSIQKLFESYKQELDPQSKEGIQKQKQKILEQLQEIKEDRYKKELLLHERDKARERYQEHKELIQKKRNSIEHYKQKIQQSQAILEQEQKHADEQKRYDLLEEEKKALIDVEDLDLYEHTITTAYKALQTQVHETAVQLNGMRVELQEKQELQKELEDTLYKLKEQKIQHQKDFEAGLYERGFKDTIAFQHAVLPQDEIKALQIVCSKLEDEYHKMQTLQQQTQKELEEHMQQCPTEKTQEQLQIIMALQQQKADALQEEIGRIKKELELDTIHLQELQEKNTTLQQLQHHYSVWTKLNELIGSADGAKFKKFAQGVTLDQLIYLANEHLKTLSDRYKLTRNKEKLLELEIIDAYQGNVVRGVATLSGGESFIVSLALALALSELASQKISIDSLFLDEGFGTLDAQSLEIALDALNLLQNRGKMVGVISHVEALKERIPLQIKVVPHGDGTSSIHT